MRIRILRNFLCIQFISVLILSVLLPVNSVTGQQKKKPKKPAVFHWVNELKVKIPGLSHATFHSPSMKLDVGYCIYLPPQYAEQHNAKERFPVVYYLHGGRPGSETKSVRLAQTFHKHISHADVAPMIYVFVNGGPVSHYNMSKRINAMGEDVFIKELIPHIDKTYRTIANRNGRGIEGFSQGGRGTTRIMFKYPNLFCSASPGGAGYATEKRISQENGRENNQLVFTPGDNTWDLARKYATHPAPKIRILIHVGTNGFNYDNNLEYMTFLESLKIPFQRLIVPEAPHSARIIYQKSSSVIMRFHEESFRRSSALQ